MAEFAFTLAAAPTLGGADIAPGGNRIAERDDLALVSVAIPLGGDRALAAALRKGWGLAVPGPRLSAVSDRARAIRTAPDQIMLVFARSGPDANATVQAALAGAGYTTDQTDAWVALEVSGPDTPAALERLCPLDLQPDAFPEGAAARTVMEHMGAMILRLGADRFLLLSASSSARSFLHAVETSYRHVMR